MNTSDDLYPQAVQIHSDFWDARPASAAISLLVIHNISLPPGQFNTTGIRDLFTGKLDPSADPFYEQIADLRVSAHCVIYRTGQVEQFVPFSGRAWHAGVSSFQGQARCNDYAIGIELEGTDSQPYTEAQYHALHALSEYILSQYPLITCGRIVGHNDIAPGRKTDPGPAFDWCRYRQTLFTTMDPTR
ncbi:1,6-anhydro-N-acetylmuramyl-L-alanine amidase AmpD [Alteromonas sp. ASW11-19]|uniref:1,6-anhydro-N-acetylmuramyl-L-alanine amidase AmpD n=1 Tax=Alteromonas salexigens TaxID=2982530 RepID=A0ABT2VTI1_9ALTE|nr:1,6-anhydro-N-acetylmuramyl-L-alanine amidase AmpD [Alteromonas salexigens]MCU7555551.1 1,6-anhydro-N-acetylmuramyl-L-alanine amidase AmpD [Alteromonas salexigens]